jgi:putative iron-dependent peroxidase
VAFSDESEGWAYAQGRDLTGFVDGTENPAAFEAPGVVAPGGAGSIVLVQTWLHDAAALDRLSEREQELLMGRTKADSIELDESVMPPTSHVARTSVTDASGVELPIFRRNTALGTPGGHGTQFVGFSADRARLQLMLERMAGVPDGIRDRLTTVASAVSGAYYYVPALEELAGQAQG